MAAAGNVKIDIKKSFLTKSSGGVSGECTVHMDSWCSGATWGQMMMHAVE